MVLYESLTIEIGFNKTNYNKVKKEIRQAFNALIERDYEIAISVWERLKDVKNADGNTVKKMVDGNTYYRIIDSLFRATLEDRKPKLYKPTKAYFEKITIGTQVKYFMADWSIYVSDEYQTVGCSTSRNNHIVAEAKNCPYWKAAISIANKYPQKFKNEEYWNENQDEYL